MKNDSYRIRHFELTQKANSFFYFLSHAFILKKFFHEDLVKEYDSKEGIELAINSLIYLKKLTYKVIYLMIVRALIELRFSFLLNFRASHDNFGYIFFLLTLIGCCLKNIVTFDRQSYDSVILLRINGNSYARQQIRNYLINETIMFAIAFIPFSYYFSTPYLTTMVYLAAYLSLHLVSELIQLYLWVRNDYSTEPKKSETIIRVIAVIALLLIIGASLYFNFSISQRIMIPVCIVMIPLGVASYHYLTTSQDYSRLFRYNLSIEKITVSDDQSVSDGRVSLDLNQMSKDIQLKSVTTDKTGYGYVFDIFISRYHKSLVRPQILSLTIITVMGIGLLVVPLLIPELGGDSYVNSLFDYLGILIYGIYFVCQSSKKFVMSCFMQIDRYLINYHFFRRQSDISANFLLRLKQIIKTAMLPVGIIVAFLVAVYLTNSSHVEITRLLVLILFPVILAMFYSIYNLSAYYLFQPYSFNGETVNKVYSFVDYLIYLVSYLAFYANIRFSMLTVIIITVILALVSFALYTLVIQRAPKNFRVR